MNKKMFVILAAVALVFTPIKSQAGLGWSYDECVEHYGEITGPNIKTDSGRIVSEFAAQGYVIWAYFVTNTVSRVIYFKNGVFDTAGVEVFLNSNAPGAVWDGPYKDNSDSSFRWNGTKDGEYAYSAALRHGNELIIWTAADDAYGALANRREANGL